MFIAKINIVLKESVLDPQGNTVKKALESMGEKEVADVRVGKYIELKLNSKDESAAKTDVKRICESLLVNAVIESYTSEIVKA